MADAAHANQANEPANAPANPAPKSQRREHQEASSSMMSIPIISNAEIIRTMGRMDADMIPVGITFNPSLLERVPRAVYRTLEALHPLGVLPIDQNNFVRMCRTLMFRRLLDIVDGTNHLRTAGTIAVGRTIMMPRPIADLLYGLGNFFCEATGQPYQVSCVAAPAANPEPWRTLDPAVVTGFNRAVAVSASRYMMAEFPRPSNLDGQPLPLLRRNERDDLVQVRSRFIGPTLADVFLYAVNEDLVEDSPYLLADCHYMATMPINITQLVHSYVDSYILRG